MDVDSLFAEEVVSSVSEDGAYVRFIADHFSVYFLVQTSEEPTEPTMPSENSAPGDNADPEIWVFLTVAVVLAVGCIAFTVYKKKTA